jgi:PKD repeat protein/subtilisin family serine protease
MKRINILRTLAVALVTILLLSSLSWVDHAQSSQKSTPNPKIDSILAQLLQIVQSSGVSSQAVQQAASRAGVPVQGDTITVVAETSGVAAGIVNAIAQVAGSGIVRAQSRNYLKLQVPLSSGPLTILLQIATLGGIAYIRPPLAPQALVISEGVSVSGASSYHNNGLRGQGSKIAVIDLGFSGLSAAQSRGELPTNVQTFDFTGTGLQNTTTHGTAVAEIVQDMAPNAQLFLMKIADEVDLENAVDLAIQQGVQIINHSVGWFNTNFYDGTGPIAAAVQRARSAGILWVNAAGNYAQRHWQGFASDSNGNGYVEFASGREGLQFTAQSGEMVNVFLTWRDWPRTSQDYDLYLVSSSGAILASSERLQNGSQPPAENLFFRLTAGGTYEIRVRAASVASPRQLAIFNLNQDISPSIAQGSIVAPADASAALAVGALSYLNWTTGPIQPFSSQGPTTDGRSKPDISGPDGVSTSTAGFTSFLGTSAAAPHVAGAAALLLSENPTLNASSLETRLKGGAIPMGSPTQFGAGRLNLTAQSTQRADLILVSPDFSPRSPRVGDTITVTAQVRNQGNAAAGPFAVELRDSFGSLLQNLSGLAAGASLSISFQRQVNASSDTIILTVDPFNQVNESDESNNTAQLTVTAQQIQPLPDLLIASIDFSPQAPRVGDTISFVVTVFNQGNAPAGSFTVELRDSRGSSSNRFNVGGLASGASVRVSVQRPLLTSPETFIATADVFNQVSESNENNNSSHIIVTAQSQPTLFIDVQTDRTSYSIGDEIRVTFTTNSDGFVYLYDVDAQGLVTLLYPTAESGNAFLRAGSYNVASLRGVARLQVSEPVGLEHVHGVLVSGAVNLQLHGQRNPSFSDPNTFRSVLTQRIQSINSTLTFAWDVAAFQVTSPQPANQPPVARFAFSPSQPFVNDSVTFDGSSSSDPDGFITNWRWVFEGTTRVEAQGARVTVRFSSARTYRVTLTVTDNQGASSSTSQDILVQQRPSNQSPVARFTFSPQNPIVNQTVTFDASSSSDPDGQIIRYQWDFDGDGRVDATGVTVQTSFSRAGSTRVTLTVTDNGNRTNSTSQTITVSQTPPPPPPPLPTSAGFFIIGTEANRFQVVVQGDPSWTNDRPFQIVVLTAGGARTPEATGEFTQRPETQVSGNASSTLARVNSDRSVFMSGTVRDGKITYTMEVRFFPSTSQALEFVLELDADGDGKRERWPNVAASLLLGDRWLPIQANSNNGVFLLLAPQGSLLPFSQQNLQICGQFINGQLECKPVS